MAKARYIAVPIPFKKEEIRVYASPRIAHAFKEVTMEMNLYKGVRLLQLLEAVYIQGKKDGARSAFRTIDTQITEAKKEVPHKNPGRPRKRKR